MEQLQDETNHLRKELESVERELQAEVENNQMLSLLNRRQEERLHEQEETPREQEKLPGQETLLEQNNENKSTLQLEQQVKELKKLAGGAEEPRGSESAAAARPVPVSPAAVHGRLVAGAPGSYQPGETAAKAQLSLVALPGEGDGGEHLDSEQEVPRPMPNIPGDLESQEAMVAFFNSAGASALEEQRVCCQRLAHPVASSQKKPEAAAPAPETGGESVCGETHRALQGAMEKLQESTSARGQCQSCSTGRGGHHQAGPGPGRDEGEPAGAAGAGVAACGRPQRGAWQILTIGQNPADEPALGAPVAQELGCADKQGGVQSGQRLRDDELPGLRVGKQGRRLGPDACAALAALLGAAGTVHWTWSPLEYGFSHGLLYRFNWKMHLPTAFSHSDGDTEVQRKRHLSNVTDLGGDLGPIMPRGHLSTQFFFGGTVGSDRVSLCHQAGVQ
ncbi:putative golgin subfamily A member 8D isoform X1 [Pongo abelii]|uniref:putative golgin subfamily A member 8D isoform X1 n=1 Tax=Pongo abelii TaxID=9601 RepID=UPI003005C772